MSLFASLLFSVSLAHAFDLRILGSTIDNEIYPDHFVQKETGSNVSLINFDHINRSVPQPPERYNRKTQFGGWRKDPTGNSCLDTRGEIMKRTSRIPATIEQGKDRCFVSQGEWVDPYTNQIFTDPRLIQIDHMVALKNAYMMGGFDWDWKKKCGFANFTAFSGHLIPVSGHENQAKGDSTPYDYMPPNSAYTCSYLKNWLTIKMVWNLRIVPPEHDRIEQLIFENSCTDMNISSANLSALRAVIAQGDARCDSPPQ
jgi:hypothetical protein